ncbi:MAG: MobA/MobL family protein, partial [Fusobacteriaceae bacterium]
QTSNANKKKTKDFSLPHELSKNENIKLVENFCDKYFGKDYPYFIAIHDLPSSKAEVRNIHAHVMLHERKLDGIKRDKNIYFKRANKAEPEKGGLIKTDWSRKEYLEKGRKLWLNLLNETLAEKGFQKVPTKSLYKEKIEAIENDDLEKAELFDREPINIDRKLLKFSKEKLYPEAKEKVEQFYQNKKIKELKEEIYKIRKENGIKIEKNMFKEVLLKSTTSLIKKEFKNLDIKEKIEISIEVDTMIDNLKSQQVQLLKRINLLEKILSEKNKPMYDKYNKLLERIEYNLDKVQDYKFENITLNGVNIIKKPEILKEIMLESFKKSRLLKSELTDITKKVEDMKKNMTKEKLIGNKNYIELRKTQDTIKNKFYNEVGKQKIIKKSIPLQSEKNTILKDIESLVSISLNNSIESRKKIRGSFKYHDGRDKENEHE